jgi:SPX domain protein involved in polyphosphate accumulation
METELKFVIPNQNIQPLLEFVRTACIKDPQYSDAIVCSIYFDNENFHHLDEKINSDYYKSKYRLRWYRDSENQKPSEEAFMEVKIREGSTRSKQRVQSSLSPVELEVIDLGDPVLRKVPFELASAGMVPEHNLFPVLQIQYRRRRFVEPVAGSRVSIDTDISVTKINKFVLHRGAPATIQNAVIEIKGNVDRLPDGMVPMTRLGMRKASFSKYLACYARAVNMLYDPR